MKKNENDYKNLKYNWDNNFSVRFKLKNDKILEHIPNSIFMVEMPELLNTDRASVIIFDDDGSSTSVDKILQLTLRTSESKSVEKEFLNLLNTTFDIEISLNNPNITDFEFLGCSINKFSYTPLLKRNKSNYLNLVLKIVSSQVKIHIGDEVITFGDVPVDYMTLIKKEKNDD